MVRGQDVPVGVLDPVDEAGEAGGDLCLQPLPLVKPRLRHSQRPSGCRVRDTVRMRILRHSKINVTMEIYTEAPSDATRDALRRLGDLLA